MNNRFFYCYSFKMNNFLQSMGLKYINKAINPKSNKPYFLYEKSEKLDEFILKWNEIKI